MGGNGRWNVDPKPHPGISPYATYAGNPVMFVDVLGDSIGVNFTKFGSEEGYSEKAFKAFLGTKQGYNYLSKFAAKGQELYGVKFNEDGEFHKNGIDLNYSNFSFTNNDVLSGAVYEMPRGRLETENTIDGRLKLEVKLNYFTRADKMTTEFEKDYNDAVKRGNIKKMDNVLLMSRVQTITHETFIHVNLSVMRKLGTPFKEYIGMGYGTDHYTEHMNTQNKVNTLWNTQGFDLLRELNLKRKTGWNSDRIWKSMWDFQY